MGYKLLLADDSITIQKVVSIIFANEECELTIVDNGKAAMEKAVQTVPDIMLVDTLMPEINGYEVCEAVRRDPNLKDTPLLLLTGAFEPFDADKATSSGADDYISKPFESQALIEKVKSLVVRGRERKVAAPAPQPAVAAPPPVAPEPVAAAPAPLPPQPAAPQAPAPSPWDEDIFAEQPATAAPQAPAAPEPAPAWPGDAAVAGWGFEEPAQENVAPSQPVPPAFEPVQDEWTLESTAFEVAPEPAATVEEPSPPPPAEEAAPAAAVVEASPEDDLWGAFALEAVDEPVDSADIIEAYTVEAAPAMGGAPDYEYVFSEDDFSGNAAAPAEDFSEITAAWDLPEEEPLAIQEPARAEPVLPEPSSFTGEPVVPAAEEEVFTFAASADEATAEPVSPTPSYFFEEPSAPEPAPPVAEPPVEAAPIAVPPLVAPEPVRAAPQPAAAGAPGADGTVTLTEEQLAAALSKISREMIERIVWEVVPDLAETLIKEEIRRIREGK